MRTRSVAAALLFAIAPLTLTAPSFAQTQAPDDPTIKAARARFNEGVEFFDKGEFENARASFLQAYALHKHPTVLLNLAESSLRAGHSLEASKYFQQYLRDSTNLTPAQRADAEKGLADARTKLGRFDVSAAAGSEIFVDGEHVGTAPLPAPIDVEPGSHTLKANAESKSVAAAAGQVVPVRFGAGGGGAIVAPLGGVTPPVDATSGVTVAPLSVGPAPPTTAPPEATQESGPGLFSPPETMIPVYIGAGVAALGAAGAIIFAVSKSSANSSYQSVGNEITTAYGSTPPAGFCVNTPSTSRFSAACQNLQTDFNQVNTDATLGNVSLIVGIGGLAFGLGWYLFAPKRDAKPAASTAPSAGSFVPILEPHRQGLNYALTF